MRIIKISIRDLEKLVTDLNDINKPKYYMLYQAYGSIALHECINGKNSNDGVNTVFGLTNKRELYYQIKAFMMGINKCRIDIQMS